MFLLALLLPLKLCDEDDLAVNKNSPKNNHFTAPKFTPTKNPFKKSSSIILNLKLFKNYKSTHGSV